MALGAGHNSRSNIWATVALDLEFFFLKMHAQIEIKSGKVRTQCRKRSEQEVATSFRKDYVNRGRADFPLGLDHRGGFEGQ